MKRSILVSTTALALVLTPLEIEITNHSLLQSATLAAEINALLLQKLEEAKSALSNAEALFANAVEKGENQEAAKEALDLAIKNRDAAQAAVDQDIASTDASEKAEETASEELKPKEVKGERTQEETKLEVTGSETAKPDLSESGDKEVVTNQAKEETKSNPTEAASENLAEGRGKAGTNNPKPEEIKAEETKTEENASLDSGAKAKDTENGTEQAGIPVPPPSADAPEAQPVATEPIDEQIEKAEETQAAVIPDEISEAERAKLKAAEEVRRAKARQRRAEFIGAAAVGIAIGTVIPQLGGRVVDDQGDRIIIQQGDTFIIHKDESSLFRDSAEDVVIEPLAGGRVQETVYLPDGTQVVTLRDPGGFVLRRMKVLPNGDEIILFDTREDLDDRFVDYDSTLPPIQIGIPEEQYIVSGRGVGRRSLADIFAAPPVEEVHDVYSLREVRASNRLRSIVRRVDLDVLTFDSGSATVRSSQVPYMADTAGSMLDTIDENPAAVFLIEGHTDAVGSDLSNLALSDRRAETVARILVDAYGVPPENLVTQGYGEQYLKVNTEGDERMNRRVTIRNITPLLYSDANR